ncbi:MAG: amylo-alpha-1,6-glucosidase [Phycisphaerales bacterium]
MLDVEPAVPQRRIARRADRVTADERVSVEREWLETDGCGGYATGTLTLVRSRRYHALLAAATEPPAIRRVLVSGVEALIEADGATWPLTAHRYAPEVIHPPLAESGVSIERFDRDPWPTWIYRLACGVRVRHELWMPRRGGATVATWTLLDAKPGADLVVRPLLAGRDAHSLTRVSGDVDVVRDGAIVRCRLPSGDVVSLASDAAWIVDPVWYRDFLYGEERQRGFDHIEDLVAPVVLRGAIGDAGDRGIGIVFAGGDAADLSRERVGAWIRRERDAERARRQAFRTPLDRAADQFIVKRGAARSIIAGYPWFADWGRDTFIAMRGLLLATGRYADATGVLVGWSRVLSRGMTPNRFPDAAPRADGGADEPEYNSVDASLWYAVVAGELLESCDRLGVTIAPGDRTVVEGAILAIVGAYREGTRYGIRMDADGLLRAGVRGQQLTWMDARVDGREITPRIGKPVEVNALWINALSVATRLDARFAATLDLAGASFERFWNAARGCLHDVIDVDHEPGRVDATVRPNQILAVGGLPLQLVDGDRATSIVSIVERELWTPIGLRTLAPSEPGYVPRYEGGPSARDAAYHQGTVWPWLLGPFVEAWTRVRGDTLVARRSARERFLEPMRAHLEHAGVGHVSEIADAEPPHVPRGCPFQAWSLGELLRLERVALATNGPVAEASER